MYSNRYRISVKLLSVFLPFPACLSIFMRCLCPWMSNLRNHRSITQHLNVFFRWLLRSYRGLPTSDHSGWVSRCKLWRGEQLFWIKLNRSVVPGLSIVKISTKWVIELGLVFGSSFLQPLTSVGCLLDGGLFLAAVRFTIENIGFAHLVLLIGPFYDADVGHFQKLYR